jgi:hypothetical protein
MEHDMVTSELDPNIYWIDINNIIVAVCGPWDQFACANNGQNVLGINIKGTSIFTYINGDDTQMWFEALLQQARLTKLDVTRPYRCDSPNVKRFMSMSIKYENSGILKVQHTILSIEERKKTIQIEYANPWTNGLIYQRCSSCGHIRNNNIWTEPGSGELLNITNYRVIYSVCPTCLASLKSRVAQYGGV